MSSSYSMEMMQKQTWETFGLFYKAWVIRHSTHLGICVYEKNCLCETVNGVGMRKAHHNH